jgi:pyruvate-formate lyase-activating enzyme
MGNDTEKLTKLHLQAFGLSDYTIKQLVKGLNGVSVQGGLKEYAALSIAASIEQRLTNSKIRAESRAKLERVLTWLNGESHVIPVDFLKGISPERRIEVLYTRLQELEAQEQILTEETSRLLSQARKMVANE